MDEKWRPIMKVLGVRCFWNVRWTLRIALFYWQDRIIRIFGDNMDSVILEIEDPLGNLNRIMNNRQSAIINILFFDGV